MAGKYTTYHINTPTLSHTLKAAIGEKLENNFCQSVQKRCREKEREKDNGNCKGFYVTCKCNDIR